MSNLRDPFNPKTGEFAKNIRSITGLDDTELRDSLKRHGWHPELPALVDENGIVIVGHRRLRLAKQLNIEPVARVVEFGKGDAADAERVRLAIVSNVGNQPFSRDDRKRIAEYLYGQKEWTMQRIAEALNVSEPTIHRDLSNSFTMKELKPAKSASNPKGAGRPKGSTKPKPKPAHHERIVDLADRGLSPKEISAEVNVGARMVDRVLEVERARREGQASPEIDPSTLLSMTAQEKLDAAVRQHKRKLDAEFEARVLDECKRRLNDISLPHYAKELSELERSISSRKGIMDRITYRKILSCLHPDRVPDPILKKRYEEAFRLFSEIEKRLLDEKQSPTGFKKMPRTYEDLMVMRRKVQEERRAKRH